MGLFTAEETSVAMPEEKKMPSCGACGLRRSCRTPCMDAHGDGEKGILIVGEAPGENEDRRGKPFIGKAGHYLQEALEKVGIDMRRDCLITNSVCCRPPNNATPTPEQIRSCRPLLWKTIRDFNPKVIIGIGGCSVSSLISHRTKGDSTIQKWRGWQIPDVNNTGAWLLFTFHPAFLMRKGKFQDVAQVLFEQDLQVAANAVKSPLPAPCPIDNVVMDHSSAQIEAGRLLSAVDKEKLLVAVDYETNMLKPHSKRSDLVSAGFAWEDGAFALENTEENRDTIRSIVAHPNCKKIAAKMKMERDWTEFQLQPDVNGWAWDTVLAAHVLDHRRATANVKYQAFVQLGVEQYDASVESYLKGNEKTGYSMNRIHELRIEDVLKYNAIDALVEYEIALKQIKQLGFTIDEVFDLN